MEKSSEEYEANSELRTILSKNIRAARKNLHLTQERLAENANISLPYLADILFKEKKEFSKLINSKIDEMFSKIIEEIKS